MRTRVAMRSTLGTEMVALDRAGKTLTDGCAGNVDLLAGLENAFTGHNRTGRKFGCLGGLETEFFTNAVCFGAGLGVVPRLTLGHACGPTGYIRKLYSGQTR